jgi:hypothetical protein
MQYIPYLSTLVTFVFAIAVFRRYLLRHGPYLLIWTIGLLWFGLGTLSEIILGLTFSGLVLKLWYLCGAMLTAAWLGQGTLHLLVRRRGVAWTLTGLLVAVSVLAAVLVLQAPLTAIASAYRVSQPISSQYQDILTRSGLIIVLTVLLNIYGTLALVGGAIYSAYIFWRKRVLFNRMIGNILIAAGAFTPAMGGSFIRIGLADWLYLTELVGVILMYIGFLQATTIPAVEAAPTISH